jgi:ubiquinone/menaquinone biosynthesis C-methylase UbiE
MIKLCLGSGLRTHKDEGFISVDIRPGHADITQDMAKPLPFEDNSVDEILIEAAFEHLFRTEAVESLRDWYNKLKVGGFIKITYLPDFDIVIKDYQEGYFDGWLGCSGLDIAYGCLIGAPAGPDIVQLHKNLYTRESLRVMLKDTGFTKIDVDLCINKIPKEKNEFPKDNYSIWAVAYK